MQDVKVVTICGSMRFSIEMQRVARDLEKKHGWCVIQCVYDLDKEKTTQEELEKIVNAHYKKIDISNAIYVVNVGGYIGSSTRNEINYAISKGKDVYYLEEI